MSSRNTWISPGNSFSMPPPRPVALKESLNIAQIYSVSDRQVTLKIDPVSLMFKGQVVYTLRLDAEKLTRILTQCADYAKLSFEMNFLAKHIQVVAIHELEGSEKVRTLAHNVEAQTPSA